jgi:hypothetical protein
MQKLKLKCISEGEFKAFNDWKELFCSAFYLKWILTPQIRKLSIHLVLWNCGIVVFIILEKNSWAYVLTKERNKMAEKKIIKQNTAIIFMSFCFYNYG